MTTERLNDLPPLPEPDVKCGEYAGPPGEGVGEDFYTADQMQAYARAAIEAAQLQAGWQDIATAPKRAPGGMILTDGSLVTYGGWVSDIDQGADWEGQLGCADWWTVDGKDGFQPTHWQPLPPPPHPREQDNNQEQQ